MINSVAVDVDGLRVRRGGREVLRGLRFTVPRGSVTGLIGPSGCGKTTLLRVLVGVQTIGAGTVTVLGRRPGTTASRRRLGYSPQGTAVYSDMTVGECLRYFAAVRRAPSSDVRRVLGEVSLIPETGRLVGQLSGGQRSRVSLAVALLGTPELLVLDEPTVGLDPVLREELWSLFHQVAAQGVTLLVSSHVMDEAARCQRLLLMREGRLLADDTPQGLRAVTGADDLDQAFLRLVRAEEVSA